MNRNVLKFIALITMIIDHIGMVFFPTNVIFRVVGRVSFPIFAFFIAEGYYYTKSKKKYALNLLLFGLISWLPFCVLFEFPLYSCNMIMEFLVSLFGMLLIDKIRLNNDKKIIYMCSFCMYIFICFILEALYIFPTGILGISLPIVFYAFRNKPILKYTSAFCILLVMAVTTLLCEPMGLYAFRQFFGLLALLLIVCYNNNVGRLKLKYLFYIIYPLHLVVIMLIKLI